MLKILKAGFFSTIQDNGRLGYLNKGVPTSGVMDSSSVAKLNSLLENYDSAAVMEITMTGPTIQFNAPTYICIGGAQMEVTLNNNPVKPYKIYKIETGDILSYGRLIAGFRNYLAIKDGFQTPKVLGSRSYYHPVTTHNSLKEGTALDFTPCKLFNPKISEGHFDRFLEKKVLQVSRGPEFENLTEAQLAQLFESDFSIAKEYNRMAYQIEQAINGHEISMLTSATLPGTVQLTRSGKLIILMKNGQTTGGYPRILQLSDAAISILAQKKFKDQISFKLT